MFRITICLCSLFIKGVLSVVGAISIFWNRDTSVFFIRLFLAGWLAFYTVRRGEFEADSDAIRAYCQEILSTVQEVVVLNPLLRDRLTFFSERSIDVHNPFKLADLAATVSAGSPEKLQAVLAEQSAEGRLRLALDIISKVRMFVLRPECRRTVGCV